jgi:hypothetical protein
MDKLAAHGITFDSATGQTSIDRNLLGGQSQVQQQVADRYTSNLGGDN